MKVCVLQPDYSQSQLDFKNYDPPRNLSRLLPEDQVDHVFLNKATTYRQLRELKKQGYDIFVNLCDSYLDWDVPSIDVTIALEQLNLPYTGPTPTLYEPGKELMKYIAHSQAINTPAFVFAETVAEVEEASLQLKFPLFVKPATVGDSLGIDYRSYVTTKEELLSKATEIITDYDKALIEEYVDGREFTVLLAANPSDARSPIVYKPIEFAFPPGERFKTFDLKIKQRHPESNIPCSDPKLDLQLREAAKQIFLGFNGVGYARLDFRVDEKGDIFFLEINFICAAFFPEGLEGSADYILKLDGVGQSGFLKHIITEGIARYQRNQKKYKLRRNSASSYGLYATANLKSGEIVLQGEERTHRVVTHSYIQSHWSTAEQEVFQRYAYPLNKEAFILWDSNSVELITIRRSCNPNIAFQGLNIVATRNVATGEELTLEYLKLENDKV